MSFLVESDFHDRDNNNQRKSVLNNDEDDNGDNRYSLGTPSASRARMLAQERDKQIRKRQSSVQNEGINIIININMTKH